MDAQLAGVAAVTAAVVATLYVVFGPNGERKKRTGCNLPPGLYNLGNTCFMNSTLQGIASLPSFVTWLERFDSTPTGGKEDARTLGKELWRILKALCAECESEVLDPGIIVEALRSHNWIIPSQQQDAHEFYQVLSSTIDDEMGELPSVMNFSDLATFEFTSKSEDSALVANEAQQKCRTKAHAPFRGLLASQLECKMCHIRCPVKFDGFGSLSLSLPMNLQINFTLEQLLHKFVCSETVDAVDCKECLKKNGAPAKKIHFIKRLTLGKIPQCLCIHIQRTYWHSNGIPYKNNMFVKFAEFLDLGPFMYEPLIPRSLKKGNDTSMNSVHFGTGGLGGSPSLLMSQTGISSGQQSSPYWRYVGMEGYRPPYW